MALDKEFIYVIGSPRSGTTWLQTMIGAHPAVATTIELTMFTNYIKPLIDAWELEKRPIELGKWHRGLPVLWTEDEFQDFLASFPQQVYTSMLKKNPQATHLLDKNPTNSSQVEVINRLVPGARFIHIIRDGRDVAVSMMAARKSMGFGTNTAFASAAQWREMVKLARVAQQYSGRYLEIRYEDLLENPAEQMSIVFEFCGLPVSSSQIAQIVHDHQFEKMKAEERSPDPQIKGNPAHYRKGRAGTWKEELTPRQRYTFQRIAGNLLCELGYAENSHWWYESRLQKTLIPLYEPITQLLYRIRNLFLLFTKKVYHYFTGKNRSS